MNKIFSLLFNVDIATFLMNHNESFLFSLFFHYEFDFYFQHGWPWKVFRALILPPHLSLYGALSHAFYYANKPSPLHKILRHYLLWLHMHITKGPFGSWIWAGIRIQNSQKFLIHFLCTKWELEFRDMWIWYPHSTPKIRIPSPLKILVIWNPHFKSHF